MRYFNFLSSAATHTTKHYGGYFSALIAALIALFLGTTLATLIAFISRPILTWLDVSLSQYFLLQGAYSVVGSIIVFVVVTYLAGVLILSALNTDGTSKNLKALLPHFTSFLFLTLGIVIASMIAKAPLHGMASLMITRHDNSVFSFLLFAMSVILHIALIAFASVAPILMLDKQLHLKQTINSAIKLIQHNSILLLSRIAGAFLILFLIHFGVITTQDENMLTLWMLCIVLFFAPFLVSYFVLTYKELKS